MRKTRRADLQSVEKMEKLQKELLAAQQLVVSVIEREKKKIEAVEMDRGISNLRHKLRNVKRKQGVIGPDDGKADDELLTGTKPKRIKVDSKLTNKRTTGSPAVSVSAEKGSVPIAALIEKHILAKREADQMWEDFSDPSQSSNNFPGARFFRSLSSHAEHDDEMGRKSFRMRIGRGGRRILDRRHPFIDNEDEDALVHLNDDEKRMRQLQKFDSNVVLKSNIKGLGPTFGEDGSNLLVDDYDERCVIWC